MPEQNDDYLDLLHGRITSAEYVRRLNESMRPIGGRWVDLPDPRGLSRAEAERAIQAYERRNDECADGLRRELRRVERRAFWRGFFSVFGWRR